MAGCPELDLGGRTVAAPCANFLGICTLEEFEAVRSLLVLEHNALVRALNAWNRLVAAGRTKWTPVPSAAWSVYEESLTLLGNYPTGYASGWFDSDIYKLAAPIVAFIGLAGRVHSATCDVNNALVSLGEQVPSKPTDPEEEKGVVEHAVDFAREVGRGIFKLAVLGVLGFIGYSFVTSTKKGR